MADATIDQGSIRHFDIPNFTFQDGTTLEVARVAYAEINSSASKVALIPTCFHGRINTTLTFSQDALKDYRIIVVALFGNGESSSPSNTPNFPKRISYIDCVHAQYALATQKLGVEHLDVVVGFSMGGQTAYHWTAIYSDFVKSAVIICSSARTSRHNYQFLEGPKAALTAAVDYVDPSQIQPGEKPPRGQQAFAKAYSAWLTSAEWFDQELYKKMGFDTQEQWDTQITDIGYRGWAADDLLVMLDMWQNGNITNCFPGINGNLEEALKRLQSRVLLMPCETDQYFRPGPNARELEFLDKGEMDVIQSVWGHVAGSGVNSEDRDWMDKRITRFLNVE